MSAHRQNYTPARPGGGAALLALAVLTALGLLVALDYALTNSPLMR